MHARRGERARGFKCECDPTVAAERSKATMAHILNKGPKTAHTSDEGAGHGHDTQAVQPPKEITSERSSWCARKQDARAAPPSGAFGLVPRMPTTLHAPRGGVSGTPLLLLRPPPRPRQAALGAELGSRANKCVSPATWMRFNALITACNTAVVVFLWMPTPNFGAPCLLPAVSA